jgi:hypothetical protein
MLVFNYTYPPDCPYEKVDELVWHGGRPAGSSPTADIQARHERRREWKALVWETFDESGSSSSPTPTAASRLIPPSSRGSVVLSRSCLAIGTQPRIPIPGSNALTNDSGSGGMDGVIKLAPSSAYRTKAVGQEPQKTGISVGSGCRVYLGGSCVFGFGD